MSIFDFRDILNDFIFAIEVDHELCKRVCISFSRYQQYVFNGFRRIDPDHKGVRLTDIR